MVVSDREEKWAGKWVDEKMDYTELKKIYTEFLACRFLR